MMRRLKAVLDVIATLAVIAAAGVLIWRVYSPPAAAAGGPPVVDVKDKSIAASALTNTRGKGDVVLIEFSDYECPFCGRHARDTGPQIVERFVDKGRIQHAFMNFPLPIHPNATRAGGPAECAGRQGRFWEMHGSLFERQSALGEPELSRYAGELGLEPKAFEECFGKKEYVERVQADVAEGKRLGVNSTPTFFIGLKQRDGSVQLFKRLNGALEIDQFDEVIQDVLKQARRG